MQPYARMIGQVALDARMAHVQALRDRMHQAAELGLARNDQFSAAIRVDNPSGAASAITAWFWR
jgi:hypothetical protein